MSNTDRATVPGGFTAAEWEAASSFAAYLEGVQDKRDIWTANARRIQVDEEARDRLAHLPGPRRVLVLTEDWCGDAARSVPAIAAACDLAPGLEHRYLDSDAHPDMLSRFLTHGGRAIPIALVEDENGTPLGRWGPRPAALQALVRSRRRTQGAPTPETAAAWYAPIMGWYGRDGGRSTILELLMLLERGGAPRS